ncbi:phosphogluconate dehydratase [Pandoraea terrigena]|uniref:Phosphogluconate dehydratase n=1 Tax=Pandoraea terrigena TaxID=2508292 RepID=A0A5E4Y6L0_9BURK|nr:phosphogluconate dehydratase [Pandoraea terrigena]VVE43982.1 phosphogluconate dehydratase [Pandoraea terrigena]
MTQSSHNVSLHPVVERVTQRLIERSRASRQAYLEGVARATQGQPGRESIGCANLAHALAAAPADDRIKIRTERTPNIGIVTAYNDMLSAHAPFVEFPDVIKSAARAHGASAQVAGGVPAMCDGVTQGYAGMELSLFSRDVIAMASVVALSHQMFDAAMFLGVCDKIVPGMVIAAQAFGHLPAVFAPAGPMPSGLPNDEKSRIRQEYAAGRITRAALLDSELAAYHTEGTCTFYGTANSNQMLMEFMGLNLPGASFVNPHTPLRHALTQAATARAVALAKTRTNTSHILDERAFINGVVGLLATGGSTNHTLHLVAMAHAGGILLDWQDFAELSDVTPLLAHVYPNGKADVNQFHAAGGLNFVIRELLDAGFLHDDVTTVMGHGLRAYTQEAVLRDDALTWQDAPGASLDEGIVRPASRPFAHEGGLRMLTGNLGRAVIKSSAVKPEHQTVRAPARVFSDQESAQTAFKAGELTRDVIVVVRFQGPQANGMPELHKLMPMLGLLQDEGHRVALVTDGRMSGASGKVPAAIHLSPEAEQGGMLARVQDGDIITIDCEKNVLHCEVDDATLAARAPAPVPQRPFDPWRNVFRLFRRNVSAAPHGACVLFDDSEYPKHD